MPVPSSLLPDLLKALISRPPGSGYGDFGALLHDQVRFDRLTLCAGDGSALRVLHSLASEGVTSDVVGRLLPASSLAGRVYQEQHWLRIEDLGAILADDRSPPPDGQRAFAAGMRAGLLFPLTTLAGPVGVCQLWSQRECHFTAKHEALLQMAAPALSAALRNDLLFIEAERRSLELGALERLARATRASLDLDKVVPASLDAALSLLGLSSGGLLLLRGDRLEMVLSRNLQLRRPLQVPVHGPGPAQDDSPLRRSFLERRPVLCEDIGRDPYLRDLLDLSGSRRTWLLIIPLIAGAIGRGVVFASGYDTFPSTRAELERMATIGHWIGSAIADAERHAEAVVEAQRRAEQQRKQQHLESLSSLAGGLAHDFNNTLGAVLLTALLVRDAAATGDPAHLRPAQLMHDMEVIIDAARRGASLAGQLLAFSRGAPLHLSPLDLNAEVHKAVRQFTERDPAQRPLLQVHTTLAGGLPPVRGDREQIVRALLNLLQNAEEAMPGGGRLRIETLLLERTPAAPDQATGQMIGGEPPAGRYARIVLQDEGPGIDPAVRLRIFEPFVTTKKSAAGLGLAVVFGVVKAHGGSISLDSEGGRGTLFRIDLPVVATPELHPVPVLPPTPAPTARILVVDDEPVLTRIAARILRGSGYSVDAVGTGADALSRYGRAGAYDLVVLDSTMPGMSGREVLDELLRRDPSVRVLVMSGYSMDGGPAELLQEGARGFLPKPFTPQDLLHAIRTALEE